MIVELFLNPRPIPHAYERSEEQPLLPVDAMGKPLLVTPHRRKRCPCAQPIQPLTVYASIGEHELYSDDDQNFVVELRGASGILSSSFNLANTILGAGILTIPFLLAKIGWVVGLFSICLMGMLSVFSYNMLTFASSVIRVYEYKAIAMELLGRHGGNLTGILLILLTAGLVMSFCIIIRENMFFFQESSDNLPNWRQMVLLWAISIFLVLPLTFVRKLDKLWLTSVMSIVCLIYITCLVLACFACVEFGLLPRPVDDDGLPAQTYPGLLGLNTLAAFPAMTLSFCGQFNSVNIYRELKDKSVTRMFMVVSMSILFVFTLNIVVGVCGYLTFGHIVASDVLLSLKKLPEVELAAKVANVSIIIVLVCSYPLICFSLRRSVEALIWNQEFVSVHWSRIISCVIVAISATIGCVVPEPSLILDITGVVAGVPLMFILPSLFVIALLSKKSGYSRRILHGYSRASATLLICRLLDSWPTKNTYITKLLKLRQTGRLASMLTGLYDTKMAQSNLFARRGWKSTKHHVSHAETLSRAYSTVDANEKRLCVAWITVVVGSILTISGCIGLVCGYLNVK